MLICATHVFIKARDLHMSSSKWDICCHIGTIATWQSSVRYTAITKKSKRKVSIWVKMKNESFVIASIYANVSKASLHIHPGIRYGFYIEKKKTSKSHIVTFVTLTILSVTKTFFFLALISQSTAKIFAF